MFLSFCSQPGVDWVISKVKSPDFRVVATKFVSDVAQMLKMNGTLSATREPEPLPEIAWQYTKAYFEEAPEAAFGVIERGYFETRLRAQYNGTRADDYAWFSLRNIVWASGSWIVLSKTANFRRASQTSRALFENALSVYTEIQFLRASMVAVQALILLAYYSEGLGKTSLQYMLCSTAMRLACSKGLHRQPARSWNISPHEASHRNWMFWSIYCLEKSVSSRSGRPSVMDDDDVSCQVPQNALSSRKGDTLYCHIMIKMMRLLSTSKKRLSSARALEQTPAQLIETVDTLNKDLEELKLSTQKEYNIDDPLDAFQLPNNIALRQAQSHQYHYFSLVLDINTPLAYPWSSVWSYAKQHTNSFAQIEASWNAVAQTSRAAILATRQIRVDDTCSTLTALFTPVYAFINLFLCILRDVTTPTTQSDLVLLDIALGYFSNIEFATDLELSLSFARDICHYIRLAIDRGNKYPQEGTGELRSKTDLASTSLNQMPNQVDFDGAGLVPTDDELFGWLLEENLESWSTMLPLTETDMF